MNKSIITALIAVLALAAVSCSAVNTAVNSAANQVVGGTNNMTVASQLWPDVPKMDSLAPSQMDMPLPVKLIMRAALGNLGRLNKAGEDQTTGNIDWIVFTTSKTSDDVKNFFTAARMTVQGWEASKDFTCVSGSEQGVAQVGVFCVFQKQAASQTTELLIVAAPDDQTKQTNLFFLRLEVAGTPTPKK